MKHKFTIVTIVLPVWLRWLKRFVELKVERRDFGGVLTGEKIDTIICDEAEEVKK